MAHTGQWLALSATVVLGLAAACGSDDDNDGGASTGTGGAAQSPDQVGDACEVASQCYPDVDHASLSGDAVCIDRVEGGYCTHQCAQDEDCCAVPGECITDLLQVCSPFESMDGMHCFLSCEDEDLTPAPDAGTGDIDATEFCQREAHPDFICRSSGGGSSNRKICVPGNVCGDPAVQDAYPACIVAADQTACEAASGEWLAGGCVCPTSEGDCTCNDANDCLGRCVAPVPADEDCSSVSDGLCTATGAPANCWCVFDAAGVPTRQCFD